MNNYSISICLCKIVHMQHNYYVIIIIIINKARWFQLHALFQYQAIQDFNDIWP